MHDVLPFILHCVTMLYLKLHNITCCFALVRKAMEERDLVDSPSKFHKSRSRIHRSYKTPRFLAVVEEMQRRRLHSSSLHNSQQLTPSTPTTPATQQTTLIKEGTLTVHTRSTRRLSGHSQLSFQSGKNNF